MWALIRDFAIQTLPNSSQTNSPASYFSEEIDVSSGKTYEQKNIKVSQFPSNQSSTEKNQRKRQGFQLLLLLYLRKMKGHFKQLKSEKEIKRMVGSILHTAQSRKKKEENLVQKFQSFHERKNLSSKHSQKSLILNKLILVKPPPQAKSQLTEHQIFMRAFSIANTQKKVEN